MPMGLSKLHVCKRFSWVCGCCVLGVSVCVCHCQCVLQCVPNSEILFNMMKATIQKKKTVGVRSPSDTNNPKIPSLAIHFSMKLCSVWIVSLALCTAWIVSLALRGVLPTTPQIYRINIIFLLAHLT